MKRILRDWKLLLFTGFFLPAMAVAQWQQPLVTGDLGFWQKQDFLGFDEVGDCNASTGDIASVWARIDDQKLFLRVTFDNMVTRNHNEVFRDNFQHINIGLALSLTEHASNKSFISRIIDVKTLRKTETDCFLLRTPASNLLEAEILLPEKINREELEFNLSVLIDGKMVDYFLSDGRNSDAEGNCAFVHHGNQGLTYTEVFYGSPGGQSGLDGSGFDEILQAHEATSTPGNFHMSGTLMPAAAWHNPEFNTWLTSLVSQGRIEMMTSALGQHIMPFVTNDMNNWSVGIESDMVDFHYNYTPRTAWVPERVWLAPGSYPGNGVIDWAGDNWTQHGVWGVVLDDSPHLNGYDNRKIHWMNNGSGISLRVISINNSFVGNMMYNANGAKNQIAGMGTYNICVYGTDWEVASEMNEHDGSFFLDNYESVLWWCHDNYPGVNVWKLTDAMQNSNFNGTGAEITPGTYGMLGGPDGYGGSNNSWYNQWAGTPSHSDFHNPAWNYGYIWSDAYNNLMTAPNNDLAQLGWYILMINLHETGWHEGGTVAGWEHRYSAHIKNANVYAEAARWAAGQYQAPLAAYFSDIDHDGVDEVVIHNQNIFAVFESIGGKVNWLFYKDGYGNAYSVVGSDMAYWSETDGDYNDGSNNHVAALSEVSPNQQNAIYEINILQSSGDTVVVELSQWGVKKRIELTEGANFLDVIYAFYGSTGYIKSGWTPELMDILWSGKSHLQRMWGSYGSYCGQRNSASGATVALVFGNGGGQHNGEFEGTLVKGDEIKGDNVFKTRLFAGYTSSPSGTTVTELNTLAAQNMDVFPPTLNATAFQVNNNTIELTFSEAVDFETAQDEDNYSLQGFSNTYTISNAIRQTDWRKVRLTIMEYWVPGDEGQVVVSNIEDLNGNVIDENNTASFIVPSGTTPHTIVIDGTNDFDTDTEVMDVDTYTLYITWDNTNLYVGFYNLNLGGGGDLFVNIDTDQVSGSGAPGDSWGRVLYTSKYRAEYAVAIEGGGGSIQLNNWTGTAWQTLGSGGASSYEGWSGNGLTEISIPWASMGNPAKVALSVHVSQEDNHIITASFPPENPTGNHPTLTHVYAFYVPYITSEMPVADMEPNTAFVLPNLAPQINSYLPTLLNQTLEVGQSLDFSISASDPENDPLHFSWFLDDELLGDLSNFTLTATAGLVGLHQLTGKVNDSVPDHSDASVTWQVEVTGDQGLYPDFTSNVTAVCVGNSVQFTDESLGEITGWSWVFEGGNPATSSQTNPVVLYENTGTYDVSLTISNTEQTESISMTDYIHVVGLATANAGADAETCEGIAVSFNAIATNYSNLLWTSAGDGVFSNTASLTTSYTPGLADAEAGYAEITFTAYPISPCFATATDMLMLTVLALPEITAQPENQSVYPQQQAIFEIEATGSGMLEYQWFGPYGEITGADEATYQISEVGIEDAGEYYCQVENDCGIIESQVATLTIMELNEQTLEIPVGWSGISSYVVPHNPLVASIFEETVNAGNLVVLQNYSFIYWPQQNINTIDANGGWDEQQGYQIKLTSAQQVTFSGMNLAEKTLAYDEQGWFQFPVLNECGVSPQVLFAEMMEHLVVIKEVAGMKIFWPGVYQNLYLLESGKSYWALFSAPVSFTYPECTTLKTGNAEEPGSPLSQFVSSVNPNPQSHVLAFDEKAIAELQIGDRLVISDSDGTELGYVQISNTNQPLALQLFADDPTTPAKDGFKEGKNIIIRLFRENQLMDCSPDFDANWNNNILEINGLSLVHSLKAATNIPGQDEDFQFGFYPNPSGNTLAFEGIQPPFRVNVYASQGQQVISSFPTLPQLDISSLKPGVYYFVIYQNEKTISRKFIKKSF